MIEKVILSEYNPKWIDRFAQLKSFFEDTLGGLMITIEHVGSTAVPKMVAKPIIDIDVVIEQKNFNQVKVRLKEVGYIHQGNLGILGREAFDLTNEELKNKLPVHYLYVCNKDSVELKRHLAFRDFLCGNPEYIIQYSKLKQELVKKYDGDRKSYIDGKANLIQHIFKEALKELDIVKVG